MPKNSIHISKCINDQSNVEASKEWSTPWSTRKIEYSDRDWNADSRPMPPSVTPSKVAVQGTRAAVASKAPSPSPLKKTPANGTPAKKKAEVSNSGPPAEQKDYSEAGDLPEPTEEEVERNIQLAIEKDREHMLQQESVPLTLVSPSLDSRDSPPCTHLSLLSLGRI